MSNNYVGLDIETTGLEPDEGHRLIQIGIYFQKDGATLTRDICPMGKVVMDDEALKVNGFDMERILGGTPNDEADVEIANWLKERAEPGSLTAVGFNVGWFDQHGFLKRELPETYKFFGRRSVDLTAITFLMAEVSGKTREAVKEDIRARTAKRLGTEAQWHDAGYDAKAAIMTFEVMQDTLKEALLDIS